MGISSFVIFCCVILHFTYATEGEGEGEPKYAALVYSQETRQIDQVNKGDDRKECLSCFTACPASTQPEDTFNNIYSLTSYSSFLQKAYKKVEIAAKMQIDICSKSFAPGMVYNVEDKSYNIGYEVIGNRVFSTAPFNGDTLVERKGTTFRILNEKPPRSLLFLWVPVLSLQFFKHQVHIRFHPDVVSKYQEAEECEHYDHNHGDEWIKNLVGKLISKSRPSQLTKEHPESICQQGERCLEIAQIMPMSYLHTEAARRATCAYRNFALVRESIKEGQLLKVDRYLYVVLRRWYSSINIIFGVSGELEVPEEAVGVQLSGEEKPGQKSGEEHHQPMPIPKLFYRIVEYTLKDRFYLYRALIVIHNSLDSIPDKDRVCSKESELEGWTGIKNDDIKTGLSYACAVNEDTIKKLGEFGGTPSSATIFPLNLNAFPHDNGGFFVANIDTEDETEAIEKEYQKIFGEIQPRDDIIV